jgi:hypothetical protein
MGRLLQLFYVTQYRIGLVFHNAKNAALFPNTFRAYSFLQSDAILTVELTEYFYF